MSLSSASVNVSDFLGGTGQISLFPSRTHVCLTCLLDAARGLTVN